MIYCTISQLFYNLTYLACFFRCNCIFISSFW